MKSIICGAIAASVLAFLTLTVDAKPVNHFTARISAVSDTGKMSKMSKMSKKDTGKMSKMSHSKMSKMDKPKAKMAKKDTTGKM
jgi:hypothetical protein